jgi:hypothetical protein
LPKPRPYKFIPLPANFCPVDATVEEVASFRRESIWTTFEKIRSGVYDAYLDGRVRKVVFASVLADLGPGDSRRPRQEKRGSTEGARQSQAAREEAARQAS